MTAKQTIYFDLDGTVYDLYNVPRWLPRITTEQDATAYADGEMLVDRDALHNALDAAINAGYNVGVITWLADGVGYDREYINAVRRIKRAWIAENLPHATEVHVVKYGTPKHRVAKNYGILVDDNAEIREAWNRGETIDATGNIIEAIGKLVAQC